MRTYEAMVLVDPTVAAREWVKVNEEVDRIVKKHGGTLVNITKWGERKLAYPVRKAKRGTYALAYFALPEKAVPKIRQDFALSEIIYRSFITTLEGDMRKEPPKDFEIAGTVAAKRVDNFGAPPMGVSGVPFSGGHERGPR